jgi:hypothetical protein
VHPDRTVSEMVEEVPKRRAQIPAERTEEPLQWARTDASETGATGRFEGFTGGAVGVQGVEEWQAMLPWARAEERHYSWLESYMGWLKGKNGRTQYHVLLEEELASLRG